MKNSDGYKCIGRLKNSKIDFYLVHCNFKTLPMLKIKNVSFVCKKQLRVVGTVLAFLLSHNASIFSVPPQIIRFLSKFESTSNVLFSLLVLWLYPRVPLMTVKYLRVLLMWSFWASQVAQMVKNPATHGRPGFDPWVGNIPWRREQHPTPVFFPGEFYGQRSLAGCSPWGYRELDTTEWLWLHVLLATGISWSSLSWSFPPFGSVCRPLLGSSGCTSSLSNGSGVHIPSQLVLL